MVRERLRKFEQIQRDGWMGESERTMLSLLGPQQKACDCRDIRGSSGEASKEGDGSGSSGEVRAEVQGTAVS